MIPLTSTPRLAPGCRLHPTADILLIPEGMLDFTGPARDILLLVNGRRTVQAILDHLATQFDVSPADIDQDVRDLLTRMLDRGVLQT